MQVAYPGANGTTTELLKFMAMHRYINRSKEFYFIKEKFLLVRMTVVLLLSGGSDCSAVGLGCDGYKLTCTYGSSWGTHSVDKVLLKFSSYIYTSSTLIPF